MKKYFFVMLILFTAPYTQTDKRNVTPDLFAKQLRQKLEIVQQAEKKNDLQYLFQTIVRNNKVKHRKDQAYKKHITRIQASLKKHSPLQSGVIDYDQIDADNALKQIIKKYDSECKINTTPYATIGLDFKSLYQEKLQQQESYHCAGFGFESVRKALVAGSH